MRNLDNVTTHSERKGPKRRRPLLKLALTFIFSVAFCRPAIAGNILLPVGDSKTLKPPAGATVVNSDRKILAVREYGDGIKITAKKPGESILRIGSQTYRVQVVKPQTMKAHAALYDLLQGMQGLTLGLANGKPVVSGRLLRFSDWELISQTAEELDLDYIFSAKVDLDIVSRAEAALEKRVQSHLLPSPRFVFTPTPQVLLAPDQLRLKSSYTGALKSFGIPIVSGPHALGLEPVVSVEILVTELRRKHFRRMGLRYPALYEAQALPSLAFDQPLKINIEAIEENGWGKVLASPRLICRNGKEASFLAGGEIPIRTSGFQSGTVAWKSYGVRLNVKPLADRGGRMSLALTTEISSIDPSQTVDGIPGLLMNKIQTHFDLSKSQTVALSGLIKNERGHSREGLPFLQNIPILGLLFSSQEYRNQETELVIFVTPQVLDPANMPDAETEKSNARSGATDHAVL